MVRSNEASERQGPPTACFAHVHVGFSFSGVFSRISVPLLLLWYRACCVQSVCEMRGLPFRIEQCKAALRLQLSLASLQNTTLRLLAPQARSNETTAVRGLGFSGTSFWLLASPFVSPLLCHWILAFALLLAPLPRLRPPDRPRHPRHCHRHHHRHCSNCCSHPRRCPNRCPHLDLSCYVTERQSCQTVLSPPSSQGLCAFAPLAVVVATLQVTKRDGCSEPV